MATFGGFHGEREIEIAIAPDGRHIVDWPASPCGQDCSCPGWAWGRLADGRDIDPHTGTIYASE
jgi:hypothetical protein